MPPTLQGDLALLGIDQGAVGAAMAAAPDFAAKNDAFQAAVADAHKALARRWHPDVCKAPDALERMQEINAARDRLRTIRVAPPASAAVTQVFVHIVGGWSPATNTSATMWWPM